MLIVEDGTNVANADSYESVANADIYFVDRNNATWKDTDYFDKEASLRYATQYIDGYYKWLGVRTNTDQVLEWPRTLEGGADNDGKTISSTTIPLKLKHSLFELAIENLSERLAISADRAGMIKRERIEGAIEVEYQSGAPANKSYPLIDMMLSSISRGGVGSITADAIRS